MWTAIASTKEERRLARNPTPGNWYSMVPTEVQTVPTGDPFNERETPKATGIPRDIVPTNQAVDYGRVVGTYIGNQKTRNSSHRLLSIASTPDISEVNGDSASNVNSYSQQQTTPQHETGTIPG
ncbi:hypothetical protein L873DRAFT_1788194 [Choiromyces venosus 120613-1]|uniref:Uncharacterized protein n=1 Tax=Choiromyces venosus 120613-1 TaxID=1336337 RepID=A0A3N4JT33_9PEZI|nr:hypothetical protein L873DRAFT_1788194 [Choiromyces venosus 120613-1]